jgi:DNA-directed RNA polymerase subunit M/transcription elongation factor TFIIS
MAYIINKMEDIIQKNLKYPNFITEYSNGITLNMVCDANKQIKHCDAINLLNKTIGDIKIAQEIEAGIFEYTLIYIKNNNFSKTLIPSVYNHKIDEIIANIKNNKSLIKDIQENVKPRVLAFLSPQQLCPDKWSEFLTKKRIKEEKENNLPTVDTYECRKCKQRKCTLYSMQTRSIDEPMTIFITCCVCHTTWTV